MHELQRPIAVSWHAAKRFVQRCRLDIPPHIARERLERVLARLVYDRDVIDGTQWSGMMKWEGRPIRVVCIVQANVVVTVFKGREMSSRGLDPFRAKQPRTARGA